MDFEGSIVEDSGSGHNYSDAEVDAMMEAIERGEDPEDPHAPSEGIAEENAPPESQQVDELGQLMAREFEYTAAGKQIKEPLEKIIQRASMGYDYAQKMEVFKGQQNELTQTIETKAQELANNLIQQKYGEIDEFARANPEWMDYVNQQYELAKQNGELATNPDDPVQRAIAELRNEVNQFKQQTLTQQQQEKQAQEDQQLSQEINSVHEKYKSVIDPSETDQFGQSLEMQVLRHAQQQGIQNYRAAFLDLFHDRLVGFERDRAKESLIKEQKEQKAKGFIGRTPTPTKGIMPVQNLRSKGWRDIEAEAIAELRELGFND